MNRFDDDDRLSGYLDGTLSAAERAEVERLLEEQPEARLALEELRAASQALGELPRRRLENEFRHQVMAAAERAMLAAPACDSNRIPGSASAPLRRSTGAPREPHGLTRWRRPLIWASLAVAASLVIMMFSGPDDQRLALETKGERDSATASSNAGQPTSERGAAESSDRGELRAREDARFAAGDEAADEATPALASPLGRTAPMSKAAGERAAQGQHRFYAADLAENATPTAVEAQRKRVVLDQVAQEVQTAVDSGALVFGCDVSPEAARDDAFGLLLRNQRIAILPAMTRPRAEAASNSADEESRVDLATQSDLAASRKLSEADAAAPAEPADVNEAGAAAPLDVFYVELTAEQLQATLAQMNAMPTQFLNVELVPTAPPAQLEQWQVFNRRAVEAPPTIVTEAPAVGVPLDVATDTIGQSAALASEPVEATLPEAPNPSTAENAASVADAPAQASATADDSFAEPASDTNAPTSPATDSLAENEQLGQALFNQSLSPAAANAQRIQLPVGQLFLRRQTLRAETPSGNAETADGSEQEQTTRREASAPARASTPAAVPAPAVRQWQRAVFVLRVLDPAQPPTP